MSHERLWAPWRMDYILGIKDEPDEDQQKPDTVPSGDPQCFICQAIADAQNPRRRVVHQSGHSICILNKFPYNNGHLLVAPLAHKAKPDNLTPEEHLDLSQEIARMIGLLEAVIRPQGFNVGMNLGRVAGAGLPGHLHWHVVPRWNGDTNFMPPIASIKVIPQSLDALWEALTGELANRKSGR